MIRPLRSRHRRLLAVVGIVVGVLLIAALLSRRPVPRMETLDLPRGDAQRVGPDAEPVSDGGGADSR